MKRKVMGVMCAALLANQYCQSGISVYTLRTVKAAEANKGVEKADNAEIPEGAYTEIDISKLEIKGDQKRICEITEDGTYLLTGSNFDKDENVYIPTQISVKKGVTATIYLKDFSIQNNDGTDYGSGLYSDDSTTCMDIVGTCTLKLLNDADILSGYGGQAVKVEDSGSLKLEESDNKLTVKTFYGLQVDGTFTMNGSSLEIGYSYVYGSLQNQIVFGENGNFILNGGYIISDNLDSFYDDRAKITGGSFSKICEDNKVTDHKTLIATISGLPADTSCEMIQQTYSSGEQFVSYGTANVKTNAEGKVTVSCLNPYDYLVDGYMLENLQAIIEKLSTIIKCGDNYYSVSYDFDTNETNYTIELNLNATEISEPVYQLTYKDMDTGENFAKVYTTTKDVIKYRYDPAQYGYTYYSTANVTGGEFDFDHITADAVVYTQRFVNSYTVTVTSGMPQASYNLNYGEYIENADEYIFIDSNGHIWDGKVTGDITVTAYTSKTVDGVKYFYIDSSEALNTFRVLVNGGATNLNGYLTNNLDVGNWSGIGTSDHNYTGIFNGNGNTITLSIVEENETPARTLFGYLGDNTTIKNVKTTGTITTNGQSVAGVVGYVNGNNCSIENCGSDVKITFTPGGSAYAGGIVGYIACQNCHINNCYYTGEMTGGTVNKKMEKIGGIAGCCCYQTYIENSCVNATANNASFSSYIGYNCLDTNIKNCYYVKAFGNNMQGTQVSEEDLNTLKMAYNLNTSNGQSDNSEAWSLSGEGKLTLADNENKPVVRVTFEDPGVYYTKKLDTSSYKYFIRAGEKLAELPDASEFVLDGQSYKWIVDENEFTTETSVDHDTVVYLQISSEPIYSITVSGDDAEELTNKLSACSYGDKLPEGYNYYLDDGTAVDYVDGTFTKVNAIKTEIIDEKEYLVINSVDTLKSFAQAVKAGNTSLNGYLNADLDLTGVDWKPIGTWSDNADYQANNKNYTGIFDGNFHVISNMTVNEKDPYESGFFGRTENATIKNLGIENAEVTNTASTRAGILAGELLYSTIENCYTTGGVNTDNVQEAGIAGESYSSNLINCYTNMETLTNEGNWTNCFTGPDNLIDEMIWKLNTNNGLGAYSHIWTYNKDKTLPVFDIDKTAKTIYRVAFTDPGVYHNKKYETTYGYTDQNGNITLPIVSDEFLEEGHTAHWYLGEQEVSGDTVFDKDCELTLKITSTKKYSITVSGDDAEELMKQLSECDYGTKLPEGYYYYLDDGTVVDYVDGTFTKVNAIETKIINEKKYFVINSVDSLKYFAQMVNAGNTSLNGYLNADLDLTGVDWEPIGTWSDNADYQANNKNYTGIFDGNFHVISNMTVNELDPYESGFFGRTENATIRNLGIENAKVTNTASTRAGILAGELLNSTIENCYTTGEVNTDNDQEAGIAGESYESTLTDCYTGMGTLTNKGSWTNCFTGQDNLTDEMIWKLNTNNGLGAYSHIWTYNKDKKLPVFDIDKTAKTIYRVAFTDPGVYDDKKYETTYGYTNQEGKVTLPDMTEFLKEGCTAHWYLGEQEVSEDTVFDKDCELSLQVKYSITVLGDDYEKLTQQLSECSYGTKLPEDYFFLLDNGTVVDVVDGSFTKVTAYKAVTKDEVKSFAIDSAEKLLWFASYVNEGNTNAKACLTTDIDMTGKTWTPITTYSGAFDGNGYTISGLNDRLFKQLNGTVKDLIIKDSSSSTEVSNESGGKGVIAGNNNGTIEKVIVDTCSWQYGAWSYLGGIAGWNQSNGLIRDCAVINTTLTRQYGGASSTDGKPIGGIVDSNEGMVENCYTYGCSFVNGTTRGGIIAQGNKPDNCYYYTSSGVDSTVGGTQATETEFNSGKVAYLLNGGKSDVEFAWYQKLDNDKVPDTLGLFHEEKSKSL